MKRILTGVIATTALLGGIASAPAYASPAGGNAPGRHCVVAPGPSTTCYDTFREAIRQATGGRVTEAPSDPAVALASAEFARDINASGLASDGRAPVSSIEYENPNHNPATLTFALGACGSDDSWDYGLSDIDGVDPAWDDRISSYQGYNGCQVNHYEAPGYRGDRTGYRNSQKDMGSMNNKTSSLRWR
ncbi:hypothetical protein JBE04_09770 [Streptomyces sp. PRKS01-29]|nr:hypothetical protein [Streptomyces sabulosicollis]MBI0294755.1 hypothetical protein [Streptomyces sabulosicollis]